MRQVGLPPDAAAIAEITSGRRRWFASRQKLLEGAVVVTLWLLPVGFYFGWVDRCFCHVLYSDNLPRGLITGRDGVSGIKGWGSLGVPFPRERRLIRLYFEKTAEAGDKLHLYEPRPYLSDAFYILEQQRSLPISLERFYDLKPGEVAGVGLDSPRSIFALSRANARLLRESPRSMIYAVAISPQNFDRQLLSQLARLPNLQQIQLSGTDVRDDDLKAFRSLRLLTGLGLNHTRVTDRGLTDLKHLPYLSYVEAEGTTITAYRN